MFKHIREYDFSFFLVEYTVQINNWDITQMQGFLLLITVDCFDNLLTTSEVLVIIIIMMIIINSMIVIYGMISVTEVLWTDKKPWKITV